LTIPRDFDREHLCIGVCYLPEKPFTHMWWARWALEFMAEGFELHAPAVHYKREGDKIIRTNVRKGFTHIYILTDEYDDDGRRLGVWPD
jgi:hypothetical protein